MCLILVMLHTSPDASWSISGAQLQFSDVFEPHDPWMRTFGASGILFQSSFKFLVSDLPPSQDRQIKTNLILKVKLVLSGLTWQPN